MEEKVILCYGDSNTWGSVPWGSAPGADGARWPWSVRWPGVLSKLLGNGYRVVEEGLGGRNSAFDDPVAPPLVERNGRAMLGAVLESHKPLDLVVIMLGVNDLKVRISAAPVDIALAIEQMAGIARNPLYGPGRTKAPSVLAICPAPIWEVDANFGPQFKGGREKSLGLRAAFAEMSVRANLPVLYAEDHVQSDRHDGIHLSAESHGILAREIAKWIKADA